MYLPARFTHDDQKALLQLMGDYPLATLISVVDNEPYISHLPLIVEESEDGVVLIGHLARANPHSKLLDNTELTVIFHGPDTYITPQWYAENDVPTWNYAVVHIKGQAQLISDPAGIITCLQKLSIHAEKDFQSPWEFWIPDDLSEKGRLESAICGVKITVLEMKAKFKLSQNRSAQDRENVIRQLGSQPNEKAQQICRLMKSLEIHTDALSSR